MIGFKQYVTKDFEYVVYKSKSKALGNDKKQIHNGNDERSVMRWLDKEGERIAPGALKIWKTDDGSYLHLVKEITPGK